MLNDLRRLRSRLGVEQEIEKSRSLIGADFDATGNETRAILSAKSTEEFSLGTGSHAKAPSTRSLSGLLGSLILDRLRTPRSVALSLILLAVFGFGLYRFLAPRWRAAPPFQSMQVRKFTSSGKATRAAISPDGKYVVHVLSEAGKQSLLVRQVAESNNIVIVQPGRSLLSGTDLLARRRPRLLRRPGAEQPDSDVVSGPGARRRSA